jgi:exo-1,4-beta-D-glucosaminidase
VVNSYYQPFANLKITAKIYNLEMTEKFSKQVEVSIAPDSSTRAFTLPSPDALSTTYFVALTLESDGQIKSRNFYWLSTREETLDWSRQELDTSGQYDISTWTPTKTFADFSR